MRLVHPTPEQVEYLKRACGTRRFIYNWGREHWEKQYHAYQLEQETTPAEQRVLTPPNALALKKQFHAIRREQFPWTWDVTKNASDQPFLDLSKAFAAFFEGKARYPRFKSKKGSKPSFYLANDQMELGDHRVWVPKLGWVNMSENLRFVGESIGARITRQADWWFIAITVEVADKRTQQRPAAVGIDVGSNRLATLSTGEGYENQAFFKTALGRLRQANKRLHRRVKGSKNREKARRQVARLHYRITCL